MLLEKLHNIELIENIKILLYKEDENVFEKINFYNDRIYKEPLLFSYFNNETRNIEELYNILFGYIEAHLKPTNISIKTDKFGRYYFPNFGWVHTDKPNEIIYLHFLEELVLDEEKNKMYFIFEPIDLIQGSQIELLKYSVPLLESQYYNTEQIIVDVEIKNITRIHREHLAKALELIKKFVPEQFQLIELYCPKMVIFDVNTYLRNSFASLSAQGIAFFNAYQEDYNEVFFVDDIAHQTGHAIFNVIIYEESNFIGVDSSITLQSLHLYNNTNENRDVRTLFHALYTYYASFMCLANIIEANVWNGHKFHEAMGRISFYLNKCNQDLIIVENANKKETLFTEEGMKIYYAIKDKYKEMVEKYGNKCKYYNMSNQPYNFTYSKFIELNPIL
jgi:hypothetical protein